LGRRLGILIALLALSGGGVLIGTALSGRGSDEGSGSEPEPAFRLPGRVRVEVLNGGGVEGVAWHATTTLRDRGFDVVYYGNAGTYSDDPSVVIDRVGDTATAALVAEALGVSQVTSEPDTTLYVDVTVRLGPDWGASPRIEDEAEASAPWWDLRRFFRGKEPRRGDNLRGREG
jgi:hypothetical protein